LVKRAGDRADNISKRAARGSGSIMRIPALRGVIDRRILVNFRLAPAAVRHLIPAPFCPRLVHGYAIGGICLSRVKDLRPRRVPGLLGFKSENAAILFAVQWEDEGETKTGEYVIRRLTNSRLTRLAGRHLFPGPHHRGHFAVDEKHPFYSVNVESADRRTKVHVRGTVSDTLPKDSVFSNIAQASEFFRSGSQSYMCGRSAGVFEGVELRSPHWRVSPLDVSEIESTLFRDVQFAGGSIEFECALLMRGAEHEWYGCEPIYANTLQIEEAA
jgi:hypothetical protein